MKLNLSGYIILVVWLYYPTLHSSRYYYYDYYYCTVVDARLVFHKNRKCGSVHLLTLTRAAIEVHWLSMVNKIQCRMSIVIVTLKHNKMDEFKENPNSSFWDDRQRRSGTSFM